MFLVVYVCFAMLTRCIDFIVGLGSSLGPPLQNRPKPRKNIFYSQLFCQYICQTLARFLPI
ncbi:hypothetical protein DsansV1_C13g0123431 [Dioscorea sansibarensis]